MFINDFTNSRCQMSLRCSMAGILSIWLYTPINQSINQMGGKSCSIGYRDCNTLTLLYAKQRNPIDKIRTEKACRHIGVKTCVLGFFTGELTMVCFFSYGETLNTGPYLRRESLYTPKQFTKKEGILSYIVLKGVSGFKI